LVDGLGHKAAYSNKAPLSIDTLEKSFSALQSFKDALAGKFGSIVETINGNKYSSNTWVILAAVI
jgi:hypothetical protein